MQILNLTQHPATEDQLRAGVIDLPEEERSRLQKLLTFDILPISKEIIERADSIAELAKKTGCDTAMIGGASYLMPTLERSLHSVGIHPVHAFSHRESVEQTDSSGVVRKINVFRHMGFVTAV
jgi:hypothetical protein